MQCFSKKSLIQSKLKKQNGVSLLEVTMATAVGVAITLLAVKLQTSGKKFVRAIEEELDIERSYIQLRVAITDKLTCQSNLYGRTPNHKFTSGIKDVSGTKTLIKPGESSFSSNIRIQTLELRPSGDNIQKVDLVVGYRRIQNPDPQSFLPFKERKIPLNVDIDTTTNTIIECYANYDKILAKAMEDACARLNGEFDDRAVTCTHLEYDTATRCGPNEFLVGFSRDDKTKTYRAECESLVSYGPANDNLMGGLRIKADGNMNAAGGALNQQKIGWNLFLTKGFEKSASTSCPSGTRPYGAGPGDKFYIENVSIAGLKPVCK